MLRSYFASCSRTFLALAICSAGASGCSRIWKDPNDSSASSTASKPGSVGEGAAIGAFSGAALGGGVGAIIGSTSGHLGEGVAVGALAGGVAGAGVGAAVYDYRGKQAAKRDSQRDEAYQREEQRRDYNSVKDSLGDEMSYRPQGNTGGATGRGYSASASGYGVRENYFGNPQAKPFRSGGSSSTLAHKSSAERRGYIPASVRTASRNESLGHGRHAAPVRQSWDSAKTPPRARLAESTARLPAVNDVSDAAYSDRGTARGASAALKNTALGQTSHNSPLKAENEEDLLAAGIDEPPVKTVGHDGIDGVAGLPAAATVKSAVKSEVAEAGRTLDSAKSSTLKTASSVKSEASDAVVAKQIGKLPPAESNSGCIQAEKEAARAVNATSDADRLFYLGRASRLCPTSDTFQVELGKVFAKIGKNQDAKSAFKKAAELNPQNDVARDELSILENSAQ